MRLFKVPKFAKLVYAKRVWGFSTFKREVFLTFDDGPNPEITPFILDLLQKEQIKACFFCVGENVQKFPEIIERILSEGHQIGNHTFKHENANKVDSKTYLESIAKTDSLLQTNLFRPPYGRLSPKLARMIAKKYKIIMWTWLSYDYDASVSVEEIMKQAKKIEAGHILVLHDNAKIAEKQKELLPKLIQFLKEENFSFGQIS